MKKSTWTSWGIGLAIGLSAMICPADPHPAPPGVNEAEEEPVQIITEGGWTCEGDQCGTESGVTFIKGRQTLTAQRAVYNQKTEIAEVSGRVRLETQGAQDRGTLSAAEAVLDQSTGIAAMPGILTAENGAFDLKNDTAVVSGRVRLESAGDILEAENAAFNLRTKTGRIDKGRLFLKKNNYHISGESFEKTGENTYVVRDCRVTTCESEKPAWSITGSEVRVTLEGYGTVKNAAFRVKNVPVLYTPYFIFPAKTKRQSGLLLPSLGRSDRNGQEVELPLFWALSDQTDLTFYEHWFAERGLMQGLEFRYAAEGDSKGLVLLDYLHDRVPEKDMNDPAQLDLSLYERTNTNRYWLRSRVDQQISETVQARLDLDLVSDQDYLRDFNTGKEHSARTGLTEWISRPLEEVRAPLRRSALRVGHDRPDYSLQAGAAYYQRPENPALDATPQPLGGLYYGLLPRPIAGLPLFWALDAEHNYIYREQGVEGHRLEMDPKVSYPLWLGPYCEFEPSLRLISANQWIDGPDPENGHQSKTAYHFQTHLGTALEKVYDPGAENGVRLKHKISPTLTYDYRGYDEQASYAPWFEPIDYEGRINRLTFALKNYLDGRHEDQNGLVRYRQWAAFELSQAYSILEARRDADDPRPFEPLRGLLTLTPFENLDFAAEVYWDHYEKEFTKSDLALNLALDRSGSRQDRLRVDYLYDRNGDRNLAYDLKWNLVNGLSAGHSLQYDLKLHKTDEKNYWIDYMLQCWGLRLTYSDVDNNHSIMLMVHLLGLGDIGNQ